MLTGSVSGIFMNQTVLNQGGAWANPAGLANDVTALTKQAGVEPPSTMIYSQADTIAGQGGDSSFAGIGNQLDVKA